MWFLRSVYGDPADGSDRRPAPPFTAIERLESFESRLSGDSTAPATNDIRESPAENAHRAIDGWQSDDAAIAYRVGRRVRRQFRDCSGGIPFAVDSRVRRHRWQGTSQGRPSCRHQVVPFESQTRGCEPIYTHRSRRYPDCSVAGVEDGPSSNALKGRSGRRWDGFRCRMGHSPSRDDVASLGERSPLGPKNSPPYVLTLGIRS